MINYQEETTFHRNKCRKVVKLFNLNPSSLSHNQEKRRNCNIQIILKINLITLIKTNNSRIQKWTYNGKQIKKHLASMRRFNNSKNRWNNWKKKPSIRMNNLISRKKTNKTNLLSTKASTPALTNSIIKIYTRITTNNSHRLIQTKLNL